MNERKHIIVLGTLLATTILAGPAAATGTPFSQIDANGDGTLTKQELTQTFGADRAQMSLDKLDTDKDGSVSWEEASAGMEAGSHDGSETTDAGEEVLDLDLADANGDGDLSKAELAALFGTDTADEVLSIFDLDGDGTVTDAEFLASVEDDAAWEDDGEEGDEIDLFDADLDGDGTIDSGELAAVFGKDFAGDILEDLDGDGDGTITMADLDMAIADDMMEMDDDDMGEVIDLDEADADADGNLTREELAKHFGDDLAREILGDLDVDSDGKVTTADLDAIPEDMDDDMDMSDEDWSDEDWGDDMSDDEVFDDEDWDDEDWDDEDWDDVEMDDEVYIDG